MEGLRHAPMVRVLRVLKLLVLKLLPAQVSVCEIEFEDSFWSKLFPGIWTLSFFLTPENFRFLDLAWSAQISLCEHQHLVLHRRSPDWPDVPSLAEDFPSRSAGCVTPSRQISPSLGPLMLALPSVSHHGKSLLDLSLTWRSAFRSDQKENYRNGWQRTSRNSLCWTNGEDDPTRPAKNSLWLECQQVGFWCQHIWFGSWVPSYFCRTVNQAQLCGVLTRVSLFDFVLLIIILMTASLSSESRTEAHPEENVCWRERKSTYSNCSTSRFLVSVDVLIFFCWRNGLQSRTSLLEPVCFVLQCWLWNVTLQSHCPEGREQANHPCAIQHPTKWFQTL